MSINTLEQLRKRTAEINQKMTSGELTKKGGGSDRQEDPRFWYPKLDENKNGYGVIRFLPPSPGADLPWSMLYSHGFKEGNSWFIENCPTTLGKDCPVCKSNGDLWKTEMESNKAIARNRKRKVTYFFNILVVNDPENPENNGQLKIFKCGAYLFQMIQDAAKPQFKDDVAVDAFDPWTGANFALKIRQVDKQIKYDKSVFLKPSVLGTDEEIEKIWKKQFDLKEFVAEDKFKSPEDIEKNFNRVTGKAASPARTGPSEAPRERPADRPALTPSAPSAEPESSGSDDAMDFFNDLAKS